MNPGTALLLVGALVVLGGVLGIALRARGARVRTLAPETQPVRPADFGLTAFGERGTVVQFSTAHCTRCPGTKRLITGLLADRPGVGFVDVDLTEDGALASKFKVLQTPTVLLIDRAGTPRTRLGGTLDRTTIADALDAFASLQGDTP